MGDAAARVGATARIYKLSPDLKAKFVLFARRAKVSEPEIEKILSRDIHELSDLALQTGEEFIQSLLEAGISVNKYSSVEDTMSDNYSALLAQKEKTERELRDLGLRIVAARAVEFAQRIAKWPEDAKESYRDYAEAVQVSEVDAANILGGRVELASARAVRVSADFVEAYQQRVGVELL